MGREALTHLSSVGGQRLLGTIRPFVAILAVGLVLAGCQTTTPQASEDVKKRLLGRKPTAEELQKAMGGSSGRIAQARKAAGQ